MQPVREVTVLSTLRVLGSSDRDHVARVAAAAFGGDEFYSVVLGLNQDQQRRYWFALFDLLLTDPRACVYGLERDSRLVAATAVVFAGFPQPRRALRFLWVLLRELGLGCLLRYLRFVHAYERVMRRSPADAVHEARAYWLFVDPDAAARRNGSELVRRARADLQDRGWRLVTGFVDASDGPLLAFYRRLGFSVSDPFPFFGRQAARITQWIVEAAC